jgi:hypothetical protein
MLKPKLKLRIYSVQVPESADPNKAILDESSYAGTLKFPYVPPTDSTIEVITKDGNNQYKVLGLRTTFIVKKGKTSIINSLITTKIN